MNLTWLDPERLSPRDAAAAVGLLEASRVVDSPHDSSTTVTGFRENLRQGWGGEPPEIAIAHDDRGRLVGLLEITFPRWDNPHLGIVGLTVDPDLRRRGLGTALFEAGVEHIRRAGRTHMLVFGWDIPAASGFAKAMGLDRGQEEVQRRQDVRALDWDRLDREFAAATERSAGYELVRLTGRIPDDMVADVARMTEAINDAPIDSLEIDDEVFTPERIRAFETAQAALQRRVYRLMARQRDTGALAGHTMVGVDGDRPWLGWQYDTSVLRAHRGHRLGLLLKIGMLRWLATKEPQLHRLDTWNAASNSHMISVNEILGYRVVGQTVVWQKRL